MNSVGKCLLSDFHRSFKSWGYIGTHFPYTLWNIVECLFGKIIALIYENFNGFYFFPFSDCAKIKYIIIIKVYTKISNYLVVGNELNLCVDVQWKNWF